jgi:DNA repair protein RadC
MRAEDRRRGVKAKLRKSEQREDAHVATFDTDGAHAAVMGFSDGETLHLKIYGVEGQAQIELPDGSMIDASGRKQERARFPDSAAVARWAKDLTTLDHEETWVLALNKRHVLKAAKRVAVGGLDIGFIDTRTVLKSVLHEGAAAFVLVHNHPSGDPSPSEHDISTTRKLANASYIAGPPLLDHVIIASGGYTSLLDTRPDIFEKPST